MQVHAVETRSDSCMILDLLDFSIIVRHRHVAAVHLQPVAVSDQADGVRHEVVLTRRVLLRDHVNMALRDVPHPPCWYADKFCER